MEGQRPTPAVSHAGVERSWLDTPCFSRILRAVSGRPMPADSRLVRRLALALPEVAEGVCHGTPGFYVRKKLFLRLREDGETLVVKMPPEQRERKMEDLPDVFFLTDHYRNYPYVLVNLPNVQERALAEIIGNSWRFAAPARLAARHPAPASPEK